MEALFKACSNSWDVKDFCDQRSLRNTRLNDVTGLLYCRTPHGLYCTSYTLWMPEGRASQTSLSMEPFFHGLSYRLRVPGITFGKHCCGNRETGETSSVFGVGKGIRLVRDNQERVLRGCELELEPGIWVSRRGKDQPRKGEGDLPWGDWNKGPLRTQKQGTVPETEKSFRASNCSVKRGFICTTIVNMCSHELGLKHHITFGAAGQYIKLRSVEYPTCLWARHTSVFRCTQDFRHLGVYAVIMESDLEVQELVVFWREGLCTRVSGLHYGSQ